MTTLTVSQVNRYIKSLLEEIPPIQNVYVMGEISNFKYYRQSGHMYFTLKDSSSQLKAVMFSSDNYKLRFMPEDGMNVVCFGQIGVYERDGVYQLYVHSMQPKGVGDLAIAFEQLKSKLEEKGYFDDFHKKPIPKYPSRIGVATSNMGAAVEDIKNVISRRYPLCEIIICPTVVQGDEASADIVKSINLLDTMDVDTIIVGRGGGSLEDLWAFNTEEVANAVFECKTPIISAVGHETDYTICDFVSDLRAPTPSAAAELAVPDINNEIINLNNLSAMLERNIDYYFENQNNKLNNIVKHSALASVSDIFAMQEQKINNYKSILNLYVDRIMENKVSQLKKNVATLNALSPLAVLSRGYSITTKDGQAVKQVELGDIVTTRLDNISFKSKVCEVIDNG